MNSSTTPLLTFDLIDTVFDRDDALEVLRTLIRAKIRHHECSCFSDQERLGYDRFQSQQRVAQLKESLHRVEELLQSQEANSSFKLHAEVAIAPVEEAVLA